MKTTRDWQDISLLWPPDVARTTAQLDPDCLNDLDLDRTINVLAAEHNFAPRIRQIMQGLVADPAVIQYRQDILADLIELPGFADTLEELLPSILALDEIAYLRGRDKLPLHEVIWRVGQLEAYVDVINGLGRIFTSAGTRMRSSGWQRLRTLVSATQADSTFQQLSAQLPHLVEQVRSIASITIGINLDERLRPYEATLLAVNNRKFRGESGSLLTTLFGKEWAGSEWEGLAPLHTAGTGEIDRWGSNGGGPPNNPLLNPLFRDLADIVKKTSRPVAHALQRYMHLNVTALGSLGAEIAFYLGGARLVARLRACGLPVCRPEIADPAARVSEIEDMYNVNLALRLNARNGDGQDLRGTVITNDVTLGPAGRIFILTGPNHGGKTTYTQGIGLAQVLAQAGLYVPGSRARISPVDSIFTHFPVEERPDSNAGRLGEEAQRLNAIFARATQYSLVLLNESLSSTSPGESLYLAQDIMRVLRRMGVRAIFATHLHELAADVDALNASTPGDSLIGSLVAQAIETNTESGANVRQTYEIVPGPPRGHSYAREIATRYGISYEQLLALLRQRGVVDDAQL